MEVEINIGDRIIYEDKGGASIKGEIVDISKNNDEEITGYYMVTNKGAYIHFHASSLKSCRLDKSEPVP
ncbi:hypothetical protein ACFLXY_08535 [Chloroflexota bacterium]